jgi:cytochrome c553
MTGTQSRLWDAGARVCWHGAMTETESGSAVFSVCTCVYESDHTSVSCRQRPSARRTVRLYIKAQLQAFASGSRRNDISQQVRNIARQMTSDEMNEAARYYAAQP